MRVGPSHLQLKYVIPHRRWQYLLVSGLNFSQVSLTDEPRDSLRELLGVYFLSMETLFHMMGLLIFGPQVEPSKLSKLKAFHLDVFSCFVEKHADELL